MALDELKVKQIPAAFAAQAQLHNALVDLIAKMRGTSGIVVQATDGGIVISLNPTALQALNTGQGTGGNVGGTVQVVGATGLLTDVLQPSSPSTPTNYPSELRVVAGGATHKMSASGLESLGAGLDFIHEPVAGEGGWYAGSRKFEVFNFSAGGYDLEVISSGVVLTHATSGRKITLAANGTTVKVEDPGVSHSAIGTGGFEAVDDVGGDQTTLDYLSGLSIDINGVTITANDGGVVLTHVASGRTLTMSGDATSIEAATTGGDYGKIYTTGCEAYDSSAGNTVALDANGGLSLTDGTATATIAPDGTVTIDNGTNSLTIDPSLITHNMTVREIDVCDGGVAKKMLIVGSAPY